VFESPDIGTGSSVAGVPLEGSTPFVSGVAQRAPPRLTATVLHWSTSTGFDSRSSARYYPYRTAPQRIFRANQELGSLSYS